MILAKSLYTKGGVICDANDLDADTCWGHEGQIMDDIPAKELGVIGSEYDAGNVPPAGAMTFTGGRIGSGKAVKGPPEDKAAKAPEEEKAEPKLSGIKRG